MFSYREALENVLKQHEEKLAKSRIEYKTAYLAYMNGPSTQALANYINAHNEYVCQLALTNGMLSHFHSETLPQLLQVRGFVSLCLGLLGFQLLFWFGIYGLFCEFQGVIFKLILFYIFISSLSAQLVHNWMEVFQFGVVLVIKALGKTQGNIV